MMTDDQILEVVQGHKEGKQIQFQVIKTPTVGWEDVVEPPCWEFSNCNYRVKPEPRKPREWWVYVNGDVLYGKMSFPDQDSTCIRVREVIE